MILTEQHIICKQHSDFKKIDYLCFLSKNLYNSCLYAIKCYYETTGKVIRYNELQKLFSSTNQLDYRNLPSNSSQQIMMLVDKNINSYFKLLKMRKKDKKSLNGCPQFPKYKSKKDGRNIIIFSSQQVFLKENGTIRFPSKVNLQNIKTKIDNLKQVRIVPCTGYYKIEVVYEKVENSHLENNNKASIDLGINNLCTLTFNNTEKTFIINGRPLKSINQYYNKKKAKIQSELPYFINKKVKKQQRYNSKKLEQLTLKRNNKINDYIHKTTRKINGKLKEHNISQLVIGYNEEWKQKVNIGKVNNQNFVSIPYLRIIDKLSYKNTLDGIRTTINEESYTSKCSALDLEEIKKHENYIGIRKGRSFKTKSGISFNSDINGSLNIGRKAFGDEFVKEFCSNRGYVVYPVKINI